MLVLPNLVKPLLSEIRRGSFMRDVNVLIAQMHSESAKLSLQC